MVRLRLHQLGELVVAQRGTMSKQPKYRIKTNKSVLDVLSKKKKKKVTVQQEEKKTAAMFVPPGVSAAHVAECAM